MDSQNGTAGRRGSEDANASMMIECVPNFSEGLDQRKVLSIVNAMRVDGVQLLDWSLDADHNRSVVTIAGPPRAVVEAAVRAAGRASELIDLTRQTGVHPRIGAADVIPFVPVCGVSLEQCAMYARQAGAEIWRRHGIPIYFYEFAAARPDRANLEDVRRGQFEGLREAVRKEAARRPDVGGPDLHPTAGASAIGARKFLVAWNVYLDKPDVTAARAIARDIRDSGGGLRGVKAMGALVNGRAQVSMNITDFRATPVSEVFAAIERKAVPHHVQVVDGELIGLIPEAAYEEDSGWVRQLKDFEPAMKILERRLEQPLAWPTMVL
jgi:glutamate formiminotransferase / 5-formyltetrahydrofolate cyclo-ligase